MKSETVKSGNKLGCWYPNGTLPSCEPEQFKEALYKINHPMIVIDHDGEFAIGQGGDARIGEKQLDKQGFSIVGYVPPCPITALVR